MPTLTINGKAVTVPKGTPILRAAAMLGFNVPHFCYHPALSSPANCRMCLVEVEKARKLEPACYLKCTEGMVVHTDNDKVRAARRSVLEFILVNHPVDCPICDQAGECKLQDYYMAYDAKPSRVATVKNGKVKVLPIGPHVVYDGERCILCTRCVRFCDEITGTSELTVVDRGDRSEIRTFPGRELDNPYSMNVTDICPVGALTTRDFRFKCRVWLMSSTDSVCTGCARGCNVHMEHFQGEVQRYRPRFNPEVNSYWMCDEGRLSYKALHGSRLDAVRVPGNLETSWPRALRQLAGVVAGWDASRTAFVFGAHLTCEAVYAASQFLQTVLPGARTYWAGNADGEQDAFLIRADKNPNRNGLLQVVGAEILPRDAHALLGDLEAGTVDHLWWTDDHHPFDEAALNRFVAASGALKDYVFQAPRTSPLAVRAQWALPTCTHAEQEGSFVNEDGMVQMFRKAFDPRGTNLPDWEVFLRLARAAGQRPAWEGLTAIQAQLFDAATA